MRGIGQIWIRLLTQKNLKRLRQTFQIENQTDGYIFNEEDLEELQKIVLQQKMNELFEEPSTYEDEEDE